MSSLTQRQQAVLDFIEQTMAEQGVPPTMQEVADAFGFWPAAALKHIRKLEEAGVLEILPNQARGIRLTNAKPVADRALLHLPLVGRVAAGVPMLNEAHIERVVMVDRWLFRPRAHYLLQVSGSSMVDAGILDGDLIAVHRTPDAEHGQTVVARVGEGVTVKKLYRRGRVLRLLPRSTEHAPIDPDPTDDFAIEGLYVGVLRRV